DHDRRIGGIHLAVGRFGGQIRRQVATGSVDRGLYVTARGVDIAVEVELEDDRGLPEKAGRGHFGQRRYMAELTLEWRRHGTRQGLGTRAGQLRLDLEGREVHRLQRGLR